MTSTYHAKPGQVERKWIVFNAEGQILGRLCSRIATVLRGKHKPEYTPHVDVGDFVIVINADKVRVTGLKSRKKTYFSHSGYPGGMKTKSYRAWMSARPEEVVRKAVRGMLPKNRLGRQMLRKVRIYAGPEHPHSGQDPKPYEVTSSRPPRGV